jgi:hypothetical protein
MILGLDHKLWIFIGSALRHCHTVLAVVIGQRHPPTIFYFFNSRRNLSYIMDLELHPAHNHMDIIQNAANCWMEDNFHYLC